jgi:hypothetical protein
MKPIPPASQTAGLSPAQHARLMEWARSEALRLRREAIGEAISMALSAWSRAWSRGLRRPLRRSSTPAAC